MPEPTLPRPASPTESPRTQPENQAGYGVAVLNGDGRLTYVDATVQVLLGREQADSLHRPFLTPEELRVLRALGCEFGQGYLFARPLPADRAPGPLTYP